MSTKLLKNAQRVRQKYFTCIRNQRLTMSQNIKFFFTLHITQKSWDQIFAHRQKFDHIQKHTIRKFKKMTGQKTFQILLLNDAIIIGEHQETRMEMLYGLFDQNWHKFWIWKSLRHIMEKV